jgi:hypothetical protein
VHEFEAGHAITAMEIYHGFLRKPFTPVHAFMYQRDPSFIETITDPSERKIFAFDYPDNELIRQRRDKLLYVCHCVLGRVAVLSPVSVSITCCNFCCVYLPLSPAVLMWPHTPFASPATTTARMGAWTRRRSHM